MDLMQIVRKMVCSRIRNREWRDEAISDALFGICKILLRNGEVSEGEIVVTSKRACLNVCRKHMRDPLFLPAEVVTSLAGGFNPHDEIITILDLEEVARQEFEGDKLQIALLMLGGLEPKEVCEKTQYSPATVSRVKSVLRGAYYAETAT